MKLSMRDHRRSLHRSRPTVDSLEVRDLLSRLAVASYSPAPSFPAAETERLAAGLAQERAADMLKTGVDPPDSDDPGRAASVGAPRAVNLGAAATLIEIDDLRQELLLAVPQVRVVDSVSTASIPTVWSAISAPAIPTSATAIFDANPESWSTEGGASDPEVLPPALAGAGVSPGENPGAGRVHGRRADHGIPLPAAPADPESAEPPELLLRGLGPIAELLPADGTLLDGAVERFLDRIEELDALPRAPSEVVSAGFGVVLAAAALELIRRRRQRRAGTGRGLRTLRVECGVFPRGLPDWPGSWSART
jgi:hypothetical protein